MPYVSTSRTARTVLAALAVAALSLLGDLIVFTNPLADTSGKVVGRIHVECVTTTGSRDFLKSKLTCGGVMALPGGTMTLQAMTSPGTPTTTGAITGGTGAYANARGVLASIERPTAARTTRSRSFRRGEARKESVSFRWMSS